ncbi:MAG: enoyl-CoA hydratase/isomerase family protein [Candidatus Lambdaproteobacteria bacterium]|nr:enoyl-CoA hydratase/isomerase family protein [Candidatus Lambdaproteobacteria bacterium]
MSYTTLLLDEPAAGVRRITLNRPEKRNALSVQLRKELIACLNTLAEDEAVRVLILTGAGDVFSAGFDLSEFTKPELKQELLSSSSEYHRKVWHFPKPTIAAVNGLALAGGFDLALLCDIRLGNGNTVFGHPEVRFGAVPLFSILKYHTNETVARDLCFTGRFVDAETALRMGLLSEIVPDGKLPARALEFAAMIAEVPAATTRFTKTCMAGAAGLNFDASFAVEHDEAFGHIPLALSKLPRK